MTTDDKSDVRFEDVEAVIAAAAKAKNEEEQRLSVEDLEGMADDLDIPKHLIAPAVEEVRRRRAAELAAEQAAAARTKRLRRGLAAAGSVLGLVVLVVSYSTYADVRDSKLAAERQHAQVANVLERQRATEKQWASAADSSDKQAELSGAENRVRIERARYDELATQYRRHASGLFGWLVTGVTGYPRSLPLSSETSQW